jgi:hydrogenase maturation factor
VTAMRDATEGGVIGGPHEVVEASGVKLRIDQSAIPVRPGGGPCLRRRGDRPLLLYLRGHGGGDVRPEHAEGVLTTLADANVRPRTWAKCYPPVLREPCLTQTGARLP